MIRVAHVAAPAAFGGLESVLTTLARAQSKRGYEVMVVAVLSPGASMPVFLHALAADGVRVEMRHIGDRSYLSEMKDVRRLLRDANAQVVHTHGYRSDVLHLGVARSLGMPIVSTAHGFSGKGAGLSFHERIQVWAWRRFDKVIAVSEPLESHLYRLGIEKHRLRRITNAFVASGEPLDRTGAREALGLSQNALVIGWIGRLSEEKDPVLAVEALVASRISEAQLCFVGDGRVRQAVLARASELGIYQRVHCVGARPEAARFLAAFDVLLLSSRTEGTPMTILEAAVAGVPIVSTAVGGVPAIVCKEALLAPYRNADALGLSLAEALRNRQAALDRAARLRVRVARESASRDWVGEYESVYRELIRTW